MTEQEELIWQEIQSKKKKESRAKALDITINILLLFTVGSFLFSPCFQLILRALIVHNSTHFEEVTFYTRYTVEIYQDMIQKVNMIALFTAVLCYIYMGTKLLKNKENICPYLKANIKKYLPLILMWLLAISIPVVTIIRGANEYDLSGHPYMHESIFSYMLYPTCYFFCGAFIWKSKYKKGLLYLLIISSLPMNILFLVDEWITKLPFFIENNKSAVFHNSNHYGYYLAIGIIASFLLFVYEEKMSLKIFNIISAVLGTTVLIVNNTLGAYIAILFVLVAFIIYSFICNKKLLKLSCIALVVFLVTTIVLSFKYNTILSSFITLSNDVGMIASDPLESDSAGSSRWKLWKGTVSNLPKSPLLGFGVEGLLNTHGVGTPHNELLQYAEFFGIPVMLIYLVAVFAVFVTVLKHNRKLNSMTIICFSISVGYFVSSIFGVAIYYTTPFFYIFLGLSYAEWLHINNK